jgi:hypothetical protein
VRPASSPIAGLLLGRTMRCSQLSGNNGRPRIPPSPPRRSNPTCSADVHLASRDSCASWVIGRAGCRETNLIVRVTPDLTTGWVASAPSRKWMDFKRKLATTPE